MEYTYREFYGAIELVPFTEDANPLTMNDIVDRPLYVNGELSYISYIKNYHQSGGHGEGNIIIPVHVVVNTDYTARELISGDIIRV